MPDDPVALARRAIAAANNNPKGPRMTDQPEITSQEKLDALRCAVAMALAAHRNDPAAVGELFNGAANKAGVIYELAKLPADLARGAAARHGEDFPVEQALADLLLHGLPQTIDNPEEEA